MYFVNLVRIKFLVESFNTFGRRQPVTGAEKFETLKIPPPFKNGKNRLKGGILSNSHRQYGATMIDYEAQEFQY